MDPQHIHILRHSHGKFEVEHVDVILELKKFSVNSGKWKSGPLNHPCWASTLWQPCVCLREWPQNEENYQMGGRPDSQTDIRAEL